MEAQRQRMQQNLLARQQFYASQPRYGAGYGAYGSSNRRRGGGGMGMGLPILGGLAGGMLLGEALDGDFGGGDFGGGDFGGGDFGGF